MSAPQAKIKDVQNQLVQLILKKNPRAVLQKLRELENDPHFYDYLNAKGECHSSLLYGVVACHLYANSTDESSDCVALAKYLVAKKPDLTKATNDQGFCALHLAAKQGDPLMIKILADADPATVNLQDLEWRAAPLHILLNEFKNIRVDSEDLYKRLEMHSLVSLKILLEHGGNLSLPARNGYTAADMLANCHFANMKIPNFIVETQANTLDFQKNLIPLCVIHMVNFMTV